MTNHKDEKTCQIMFCNDPIVYDQNDNTYCEWHLREYQHLKVVRTNGDIGEIIGFEPIK